MKLIIKLAILAIALTLLVPAISPGSSLGSILSAALEDARTFCDRQAEACQQGAAVARQTAQALADVVSSLTDTGGASGNLTADDRALAPGTPPDQPEALQQQPAIATHNMPNEP
ncbi:MAG: hypothetical protein AAGF45_08455 [Pseudomonadota bacterium]